MRQCLIKIFRLLLSRNKGVMKKDERGKGVSNLVPRVSHLTAWGERSAPGGKMRDAGNEVGVSVLAWSLKNSVMPLGAVSNGLIQFESAHKIWPLLKLLVIKRWELACSCLKNFCNFACSYAWIFVKILCCVAKASFASWKQKLTLVQCFHSGKTGKHALYPLYINVSENMLPCFVAVLLKLTGQSLIPGRYKCGLSWTL